VWLGDIPVATLQPNTTSGINLYYVHTDDLNTPRAVTRPADNVLMWTWFSDPFGTDAASPNPLGRVRSRITYVSPDRSSTGRRGCTTTTSETMTRPSVTLSQIRLVFAAESMRMLMSG
jgi:hypothetical protein